MPPDTNRTILFSNMQSRILIEQEYIDLNAFVFHLDNASTTTIQNSDATAATLYKKSSQVDFQS